MIPILSCVPDARPAGIRQSVTRLSLSVCLRLLPVVFFCLSAGCAVDPTIVSVFGGATAPPGFLGMDVVGAQTYSARFSAPVTVLEAELVVEDDVLSLTWSGEASSSTIMFTSSRSMPAGSHLVISARVRDERGNTLSFAVPVIAWNGTPARLSINEVRFAYSKPRVEFIEFVVTGRGNLAGIEVFNARNTVSPVYTFPAIEVPAGLYIVLHFRSVEEGVINEDTDLSLSGGKDAHSEALDLWDTQTKAPLKTDNVIIVRERKGGPMMDALLCSDGNSDEWPTDLVRESAVAVWEAGLWQNGPLPADAALTAGHSATRTLGRVRSSTGDVWIICPTGKGSPGFINYSP